MRYLAKLGTGLVTAVIIARILGPEGNGYYHLAILLPQFLGNFLNLGWSASIVYHISSKKTNFTQGFYASIIGWLISSLTGLVVGGLVIHYARQSFFPEIPMDFLLISLSAFPLIMLMEFTGRLFQGVEAYRPFNTTMLINGVAMLVILLILFILDSMSIYSVLWAYVGSFGLAGLYGLVISLSMLDERPKGNEMGSLLKSLWSYGGKAHASNVVTFFNYRIDLLLINFFMAASPTGIYAVAVQIAERLWLFAQAASSVLFPRISALKQSEENTHNLTALISRGTAWITLLAALILGIFIVPIIELLFGVAYLDAAIVLILLLPGIVAGSISKILANDFAGRGKPEYNLAVSLTMLGINVICNIWLIPIWGINGAAVATSVTYFGQFLATLIIYRLLYDVSLNSLLIPTGSDFQRIKSYYHQLRAGS